MSCVFGNNGLNFLEFMVWFKLIVFCCKGIIVICIELMYYCILGIIYFDNVI